MYQGLLLSLKSATFSLKFYKETTALPKLKQGVKAVGFDTMF